MDKDKKSTLWAIALSLMIAALSILVGLRDAAAAGPFQLDEAGFEFKQFGDFARHPYFFEDNHPRQEVNFFFKNSLLNYGYMDVLAHSMTDEHQFKVAGLNLNLGIRLFPWLDVGYEHWSIHLLDTTYPHQGFGVRDALVFRVFFVGPEKRRDGSLLP